MVGGSTSIEYKTVVSSGNYRIDVDATKESFRVVFHDTVELEVSDFKTAKLLLGIWKECGVPTMEKQFNTVPTEVAVAGKPYIAAYLAVIMHDMPYNARTRVSESMSVSEQTVSNYWNQVRWSGCLNCGNEDVEEKLLHVDGDEVQVQECDDCGAYQVAPEDTKHHEHEPKSQNCVSELKPVIAEYEGDDFRLFCCPSCGFYSSRSE